MGKPAGRPEFPGRAVSYQGRPAPQRGLEAGRGGGERPWAGPRPGPPPRDVTAPWPRLPRPGRLASTESLGTRGCRGAPLVVGGSGAARGVPGLQLSAGGRLRVGLGRRGALGPRGFFPGPAQLLGFRGWVLGGRRRGRAGGSRIRTRPALRALSPGCGGDPAPVTAILASDPARGRRSACVCLSVCVCVCVLGGRRRVSAV